MLSCFLFFAFRILVNKHLEVVSQFVSSGKTLEIPLKPLAVHRNSFAYKGQDEIDDVVSAVNHLGNELQTHIGQLVTMSREAEVVNLRLLEAMRMESLGKQASSISHEFNNSLGIISGAIELISASEELPAEVRKRLAIAEASVRNASELTGQLLRYAKKKKMSFSPFRMDEFADELEQMLAILVNKSNNLVVLNLTQQSLFTNKEMLISAIINLVKNANEALVGDGEITVIINNMATPDEMKDQPDAAQTCISIEVIDNGPGIPEALQEKLFDPFVTTKTDQGGTGLGLWTVQNFVRESGGSITYQPAVGGGSHFRLVLPVEQNVGDNGDERGEITGRLP